MRGERRCVQLGQEWLTKIVELLSRAGIASGEEYASAPAQAISQPVAAVGLRGLDWGTGKATVCVRILSPRCKGGWLCQTTAAKAVAALEQEQIRAKMEQMEYLPGCDCFEVVVVAVMQVREMQPVEPPVPPEEKTWHVSSGSVEFLHVTEFEERQDLNRRFIAAHGQEQPVGITPGSGGWEIRLVQKIPPGQPEQEFGPEPFAFTVSRSGVSRSYSGCGWNQTRREYSDGMLTVECRGFALNRRVEYIG